MMLDAMLAANDALVPMQFQKEAATYFDVVSDFDGLLVHFIEPR